MAITTSRPTARTAPAGTIMLRVALGAMYLAHALLKLVVFTLPGTAQFFAAHGIPGVLAYPVFAAELVGGALLIVGIYARQVALALTPILLGALAVHAPNGWLFTAAGGGWEYPAFLLIVSLALWLSDDDRAAFVTRSQPASARAVAESAR